MSHQSTSYSLRASSMEHFGHSCIICMALHCKCHASSAEFRQSWQARPIQYVLGTLGASRTKISLLFLYPEPVSDRPVPLYEGSDFLLASANDIGHIVVRLSRLRV